MQSSFCDRLPFETGLIVLYRCQCLSSSWISLWTQICWTCIWKWIQSKCSLTVATRLYIDFVFVFVFALFVFVFVFVFAFVLFVFEFVCLKWKWMQHSQAVQLGTFCLQLHSFAQCCTSSQLCSDVQCCAVALAETFAQPAPPCTTSTSTSTACSSDSSMQRLHFIAAALEMATTNKWAHRGNAVEGTQSGAHRVHANAHRVHASAHFIAWDEWSGFPETEMYYVVDSIHSLCRDLFNTWKGAMLTLTVHKNYPRTWFTRKPNLCLWSVR